MATAITMPRLGLSMVEGTVTEWRVDVGATVERGQQILIVESEKAEVEVEAFGAGRIAAVYVPVGETVPIGALLGAIVAPGEEFDAERFAAEFVPETEGAPATASPAQDSPLSSGRGRREAAGEGEARPALPRGGVPVAPAARALAKKLGVDLARVRGSGPGGRIQPVDVERAAATPAGDSGNELDGEISGEGPSIVFVSGFGVDRSGWRRQIDALRGRFTVAAFDHRGVGASPALRSEATIADLADDLAATIRVRGLERPTLVGASLGAAVVLELALRHAALPARIACLAPIVSPDSRFAAVLKSWADTDQPEDERRIRAMLPWLFGRTMLASAGKRAAAAAALRAMAAQNPTATLTAHAEALLGWLGSRTDDLARIAAPTLVLAGDEDVLTPLDQARLVASHVPGARLEIVLRAGHALMVEEPDSVNAALAAFAAS